MVPQLSEQVFLCRPMTILPIKTFQRIPIRPRNSSLFKLNTGHSHTATLFPKGGFITPPLLRRNQGRSFRGTCSENRRSSLILIPAATCKRKLCPLSKRARRKEQAVGERAVGSANFLSMEMDGFTTESTVIFICLRTGKTAFGLTVRNAGGSGRLRTCIHTSIRQIKVPGCTCWESPTEKASFSITEPIGRVLRKINFREVAVKQLTGKCRLAISQCGPKDCICFEIHLDPVINERLADPCQKKPYLRPIGLPHRN